MTGDLEPIRKIPSQRRLVGGQRRCVRISIDGFPPLNRETIIRIDTKLLAGETCTVCM